jgi:hypothetical protein
VLDELGLIEFEPGRLRCQVLEAPRTELDRSAAYRAYRERLAVISRALEDEPTMRTLAA